MGESDANPTKVDAGQPTAPGAPKTPPQHGFLPLEARFLDPARATSFFEAFPGQPLALICYEPMTKEAAPYPVIQVGVTPLHSPPQIEVWLSRLPVVHEEHQGLHLSRNEQVLFGSMQVPHSEGTSLEAPSFAAYQQLLARCRALGYPHFLRFWNVFPAINRQTGGLERYQQFCVGRYRAFAGDGPDFTQGLPAASAIGTGTGPLQIYFLASREPGRHVENPRQVSAYDYPSRYGPRSPSFARATLRKTGSAYQLFIAGTASIVGHASRHLGDPEKQAAETIENVNALIEHTEKHHEIAKGWDDRQGLFKVYLRHPEHLAAVSAVVRRRLPKQAQVLYLQAEICRSELLVEIEAIIASADAHP
jgi:chorismate lyase/3-hydroxybenzoate synthase